MYEFESELNQPETMLVVKAKEKADTERMGKTKTQTKINNNKERIWFLDDVIELP